VGALPSALLVGRSQANVAAVTKWLGSDEPIVLRLLPEPADEQPIVWAPETIAAIQASAARQRMRGDPLNDPSAVRRHVAGEPTYDIDPVMLAHALRAVVPVELKAFVKEQAQIALARSRGRVD
jgi:hypothetical protein